MAKSLKRYLRDIADAAVDMGKSLLGPDFTHRLSDLADRLTDSLRAGRAGRFFSDLMARIRGKAGAGSNRALPRGPETPDSYEATGRGTARGRGRTAARNAGTGAGEGSRSMAASTAAGKNPAARSSRAAANRPQTKAAATPPSRRAAGSNERATGASPAKGGSGTTRGRGKKEEGAPRSSRVSH